MTAVQPAPARRRHILPPNATALERAVDETMPAWDSIANAFPDAASGEPPAFAPWLAAEWNLAQFARYFPDLPALIEAGMPWLMERGSAAATLRVLAWVGFPNARLDQRGARLHIDLGRPATAEEIGRIAHVVRATVPAHVQFWRVFNGYDRRPVRLDGAQRLDQGLLDDDSGVWVSVETGEPVKASFGPVHRGEVGPIAAGNPMGMATIAHMSRVTRRDKPVLDAWRLDSRVMAVESGGMGELRTNEVPVYVRLPCERAAPGLIHAGECPWQTPPPESGATATVLAHLPPALPQPQGWNGTWGGQSWRPLFIESKATESF